MTSESISFDVYHPRPLIVVISGPSAAGKDAVVKELKNRNQPFHFLVTATSRPPRQGETNGVDYWFVTKEQFETMIANNELAEYSIVYDDYKGIPKIQVEKALQSGLDVIMRVDVQGAAKVCSIYPEAISIFLVPKDPEEWRQRLENRKTETQEGLQRRMEIAREEMTHMKAFDYVVVNPDCQLDQAADDIIHIIHAEHHRTVRQAESEMAQGRVEG